MHTPNFHVIEVKFLGPTNVLGSRVKMIDHRFETSKTVPYDHAFNSSKDVATDYLTKNGFDIVGSAEGKDSYLIITNTFEPVK